MGKGRLVAEKKIEAFVTDVNEWAKEHGHRELNMGKRVRVQLIHQARNENKTIDQVLKDFRPVVEKILSSPEAGKPMAEWSEEEFARYLRGTGRLH